MNVIQWAVWGSYLTSMGSYLASVGLAKNIGIFYAMQGIVSIFMPTLMGIVADKFIPAQKLLGLRRYPDPVGYERRNGSPRYDEGSGICR